MRRKMLNLTLVMCILAAGCEALSEAGADRDGEGALYVADAGSPGPGGRAVTSGAQQRGKKRNSNGTPAESTPVTMESSRDEQLAAAPASLTESLHDALGQVKDQRARIATLNDTVTELKEKLAAKKQEVEQLTKDLAERDDRVKKLQEAVDKWKQDILGYRDEMRQAEEAEMKAITRIIALLKKCSSTDISEAGDAE